MPLLVVLLLLLAVGSAVLWTRNRRLERERLIRAYVFPKGLLDRLAKRRPELDLNQRMLVSRGLRQFFLAYLNSGRQYVAMPSQAADDLWHEFILYTKAYEAFCHKAFGGFLHHSPAVILGGESRDNEGLHRVWWQTCKEENINPRKALRLPLLFALDAKLGISDGFHYQPDCSKFRGQGDASGNIHCGADFSAESIDSGTSGSGDSRTSDSSDQGSSDSNSDSGGCGGGGCGGGD